MSENEQHDTSHLSIPRKEMSRRQFLAYTLGGTTAFLVGGPVLPMIRFAVDPILEKKTKGNLIKVVEESKITKEPQEFTFQVHQVDGWYESDPKLSAWISRDANGQIFALSPICKHLGCTIAWNTKGKNEFDCPCHDARYNADGKNLAVAPNPLDEYEVKVDKGFVYLGPIKPNSRV